MVTISVPKLEADLLQALVTAGTAAATGDPAALIALAPQLKDLGEMLLLALPAIDATSLNPDDRAAADAAAIAQAEKP